MAEQLCHYRKQLLNALTVMLPVNRNYLLYSVEGRIVLEEVIAELWEPEIRPLLKRLLRSMPLLYRTTLLHVPRIRRLFRFTEERLGPKDLSVGPCGFVDFLRDIMKFPGIDRDFRFLTWVLSCPIRCEKVFSVVS